MGVSNRSKRRTTRKRSNEKDQRTCRDGAQGGPKNSRRGTRPRRGTGPPCGEARFYLYARSPGQDAPTPESVFHLSRNESHAKSLCQMFESEFGDFPNGRTFHYWSTEAVSIEQKVLLDEAIEWLGTQAHVRQQDPPLPFSIALRAQYASRARQWEQRLLKGEGALCAVIRDAANKPPEGEWSSDAGPLDGDALLKMCGATATSLAASSCRAYLRASWALIGAYSPRRHCFLSAALALLALAMTQLFPNIPAEMPVSNAQPLAESSGWVDRCAMEETASKIACAQWPSVEPGIIAQVIQSATNLALQLGYLDENPGSVSRRFVRATPNGLNRAREFVVLETAKFEAVPQTKDDHVEKLDDNPSGMLDTPPVQLGHPGEPCAVLGKPKKALTDGERAVIEALLKAGTNGLTKDALEKERGSARRILKSLRRDSDWAQVIQMAGRTNGRYRIRQHAAAPTYAHL